MFSSNAGKNRNDFELCPTALGDHFANQGLREVHVGTITVQLKKLQPQTLLSKTKAQSSYQTTNLPTVAPLALPGDVKDADRAEYVGLDDETAQRAARLQVADG